MTRHALTDAAGILAGTTISPGPSHLSGQIRGGPVVAAGQGVWTRDPDGRDGPRLSEK